MKKVKFLKLVVLLPLVVLFIFCDKLLAKGQADDFLDSYYGQEVSQKSSPEYKQLLAERARQEQGLRVQQAEITKQTQEKQKQLAEQEKLRLKKLAEQSAAEEREFIAQQKKFSRQKKERQRKLAEDEIKRQQELEAKQKELAREIEEKRKQIVQEEARRLQEIRMRQQELARQIEERQSQVIEKEARHLQELKEKESGLALARDESLKKIAEERARKLHQLAKLEQERQAKEAKLQQELQDRRKKETKAREEARIREQQRQEEFAHQQAGQRKRLAELEIKRQEEQTRKERAERLRLERLAKEREEREEQLARQKSWRERQLVEERIRREKELWARQEQSAKEKLEKQKQTAQLKSQKQELTSEREKWQKQIAQQEAKRKQELNAGKQRELQARQMQVVTAREQSLKGQLRQADVVKEKAEKQKQLAAMKAKQEQGSWSQQQQLTKEKEARQQYFAVSESQQKQVALQPAKTKQVLKPQVNATKRLDLEEKALSQAKLTKQGEDAEKIRKADELWMQARKLYSVGMYQEAIRAFQEIIKIEGNPRIKYTPYAKDYIEKANAKIEQQTQERIEKAVESKEKLMLDEVVVRQLPTYVEPPPTVEKAKELALIEPPPIRKQLKEKKISMDFDKVDLKSVISFLSQESGINFVASQKALEMGLKVTARFDQTPIYEVVKYITKSLGLLYRVDKEVVWIAHPEEIAQESLETRVYYLNKGGGLFTEFSGSSGGTTESGLGSSSAQISKIYTLEDTLKEVVSWPQDAKLTFDKRINALIVRNTPQNLQMLEDILYNLDITPFQILIEARFLEVDVTDTKEFGLEWKFAPEDFPFKTKGGAFEQGIASNSGSQFSAFSRAAEGLNLTYKGVLTTPQFETVLHALDETKKIKTLSSPRITTLNNQMATIKVVDEWIYPTRYDYEIVQFDLNGDGDYNDAGETTFKNVPKDFVRRDVGILLKVIPSVGNDKKTISLSLIPEVSEATADFFSYTGDVKLPKFTSRNLSTTVVVNSGDTVVLGGLIKENRTKVLTKVPIMADIPFLGVFFRKNTDSIERKNLIIFVTAKLLTSAGEEVIVVSSK